MYLTNYVNKFGNQDFKEMPFNDVDACVLSIAVYSNFEVIAPTIYDEVSKSKLIKDIFNFDLSIVTAGRILVKDNKKLIPAMRKSKRFGNIGIKNICKIFDDCLTSQFYACTYIIPDVGIFIAVRGTDSSVVGWKEDLMLSTKDVIIAQIEACNYITKVCEKEKDVPVYIGGHSKGGNLVLYGSINASNDIKSRIVNVYSFDGNGLNKDDYLLSEDYLSIKHKIKLFRAPKSIVTELMYNPEPYKIVKSKNFSIFQHDCHSWKINKNGEFIETNKKQKILIVFHYMLEEFLIKTPLEDKDLIINIIVDLLGGVKITIFDYFFSSGKLLKLIKTTKNITTSEKERLLKDVKILGECFKNARKKVRKLNKVGNENE